MDDVAKALRQIGVSTEVEANQGFPANVVDGLAILAKAVDDGLGVLAVAVLKLAEAIQESKKETNNGKSRTVHPVCTGQCAHERFESTIGCQMGGN